MNLSMRWLGDYINTEADIKKFAAEMTMSGSKVEVYSTEGTEISNVVVGKVTSIEKAENSDKLFVCLLDVGAPSEIQIVTGAQNVFKGALVPAALDNSTLPGGVTIKAGKLRGIDSNGMLCSLGELGLTVNDFPYADADGIFILNKDPDISDADIGKDIKTVIGFNDTSVEFEITNNRPDCLSVIGLAKEASATFKKPLNIKAPSFKGIDEKISDYLSVDVQNTKLCTRYIAGIVKNVKIQPSPRWMRERLRASGVRPINNFVDITNYVMLEYGHPMHAFDLRYVDDSKIIVRNAADNETITTLDGIERKLSPEMLVIADSKKPVAVAGVMGGEFSGIMSDTTTVVFESAHFNGVSVRTTAKKLNMRTDASSRFEKGIDPLNAYPAILRALELVELLECGEVVKELIDADYSSKEFKRIKHDYMWINKFLGVEISELEQIDILKSLGFAFEGDDVIVPSTRIDMDLPYDLAEEIARIYGYNNIPSTSPKIIAEAKITPHQKYINNLHNLMTANGLFEVETFSFISPKSYEKIQLAEKLRESVVILNPLGEDTSVMRSCSIPSMMEVIARNYNNRTLSGRFYEINREYKPVKDSLPNENNVLVMGIYGDEDFYSLKGIVEEVFDNLKINVKYKSCKDNYSFHTGRCACVFSEDGEYLGIFGEVHPVVAENYDINSKIYIAVLELDKIEAYKSDNVIYKPLPKYPSSARDLSLVCDNEVASGEIMDIIKENALYLQSLTLFDVYAGDQIEKGKKSISYKLVLRSDEKTLTDADCDSSIAKVITALAKKKYNPQRVN